jgi:hypothetical protein
LINIGNSSGILLHFLVSDGLETSIHLALIISFDVDLKWTKHKNSVRSGTLFILTFVAWQLHAQLIHIHCSKPPFKMEKEMFLYIQKDIICFWWDWGLNSGLRVCKAGSLLLEPPSVHFALILLETGFKNYLPRLALNHYCDHKICLAVNTVSH